MSSPLIPGIEHDNSTTGSIKIGDAEKSWIGVSYVSFLQ